MTFYTRLTKRDFSDKERAKAASSGAAMEGGAYPIYSGKDLKNAIMLSGMSNHSDEAVKAHIKERAKAIGKEGMLPSDWK